MNRSMYMKTLSLLSALFLLIAAASVSASALGEGATSYQVTVESGSDVYTPENPLITVSAGETVTLSIPDDLPATLTDDDLGEYAVSFSCWRFTGEYEMVQGAVNEDGESLDKTVVFRPLSDMKAVACFYEDNAQFHMVRVDTNSAAYEPLIEQGECVKGEKWTFSVPDDLDGFVSWTFEGDYDVVEGTVDEKGCSGDRTVVLKPLSGIRAYARFEEEAAEAPSDDGAISPKATPDQPVSDTKQGNGSKTSPKTGDALPLAAGIMMAAVVTSVIAIRKIRE